MHYPQAPRDDLVEELHGRPVADPYRWLEDAADPGTQAWSLAQDELARDYLDSLPGRDRIRRRLTELLGAGLVTVPVWRGNRAFFQRRSSDQEHAVLYVRDGDGSERALVDPGALSPDGTVTLDAWQPDKEGRRLAYQLSEGGDEESSLRVLDVATGRPVDAPIDRTRYSPVAWLPGGEAFFYVRRLPPDQVPDGEQQFHRRVYLHRLGTSPDHDVRVHGDGLDKTNYYGVSVSRDGRWMVVSASAGTAPRDDVWLADLHGAAADSPRLEAVQLGVDAQTSLHVGRDGRLYVLTDRDAPRRRLCVASPEAPAYENWVDLVPESPDAVLEDFEILDGEGMPAPVLVIARTQHAVGMLTLCDLATGTELAPVPMPGLGSLVGLTARPEGGHEVWFGYTDHATPPQVHCFDTRTGAVSLWADAPGQVDVPRVSARQVTYAGADGTPVRMFVLHPAADPEQPPGPRPTILYGYGGFNVSLTPGYSATVLAWVEAGGVYAIANLRGGSEEGEAWHRAGMREHKQNVFDDFAAAAQWLVAGGWCTPELLGISGGSNGGLLVGAALTQRPELFAAVVCSAPLLDMVRYEQFGLGRTWNDEYGTAADPVELGWLLSYSPYHRVRPGTSYPAVLFTVFDSDTRVDPMHARKLCAALQHATTSDAPVLLRRERDVGHGARSVSRTVELAVDTTTFLAARTGLDLSAE
ncbi:MAG: prolyl oligopeptidase family serine peptidase [Actinomycetota bacterium]|nr:prolyl oligopeptidase family serine peptidase [Actinomycetota bacterium]